MDQEAFDSFGQFFRAKIMPLIIADVDKALNLLRLTNPEEWLRIAMQMRQLGPYDRAEQLKESQEILKSVISNIAAGLSESLPEFIKLHQAAIDRHYVEHGLELDDLLKRHPHAQPMTAKEAVDAQFRAMGINIRPDDPR